MDKKSVAKIILVLTLSLITVLVVVFHQRSMSRKIVDLQNQIAQNDKTIELEKGLFSKKTEQVDDLSSMLDEKGNQLSSLRKELKKRNDELAVAHTVTLQWKKAWQAVSSGKQTELPGSGKGSSRTRVDFSNELGPFSLRGFTLTNPPESSVNLSQTRSIKLTVALSRGSDGSWSSYATSSDPDLKIDIISSGIDLRVFKRKWYERLGIMAAGGVNGSSAAASAGLLVDLDKFELGPVVYVDQGGLKYGLSVAWRPFFRR